MLAALLVAIYEDDVDTVFASGGLVSYRSLLASPYPWAPHDALIPGQLAHGDIDDWLDVLKNRKIWLVDLRDGQNRRIGNEVPDEVQVAAGCLRENNRRLSQRYPGGRAAVLARDMSCPRETALRNGDRLPSGRWKLSPSCRSQRLAAFDLVGTTGQNAGK